jgi:hypothetical protein
VIDSEGFIVDGSLAEVKSNAGGGLTYKKM